MSKDSPNWRVITIKGGQRPSSLKPETLARIARGVAAMKKGQQTAAHC